MLRRWTCVVLFATLSATLVLAKTGTVTTRDGQRFQGDITEEADHVDVVNEKGIKTTISRKNVVEISYFASIDEKFDQRFKDLEPTDVEGRIALARWAFDNRAYDLARQAIESALEIDSKNREAIAFKATIEEQVRLNRKTHGNDTGLDEDEPRRSGIGRATTAPTKPLSGRLLTPDEVNLIRQSEWKQSDEGVRVRLLNDVKRRYVNSSSDVDPADFNEMDITQQAMEILEYGKEDMRKDVRIVNDPPALREFRQIVQRMILTGCATAACHGGEKAKGLYLINPAELDGAAYANFLALQKYRTTIAGQEYAMIDRTTPGMSLLTQFALPKEAADVHHPATHGYRPLFKSRNEPRYRQLYNWISQSLRPVEPNYDIDLTSEAEKEEESATTRPVRRGTTGPLR